MKRPVWLNVSNGLSFARMLLAAPAAMAIARGDPSTGILYVGIAFATDVADGALARALNQITEAGKIIDPLADKVFVGACAVALVSIGRLPVWFLAAVVGRDALIIIAAALVRSRASTTPMSNNFGRLAVVLIGLALTGAMAGAPDSLQHPLEYAATAGMLFSLVVYARRAWTARPASHGSAQ
jgi:phosphatidylglycerophosphate synthase